MVRIAMWSGPRNLSTALLRAFEGRGDCHGVDEPLYAAYLAATGLDHPLRDSVLASQPTDWREAVSALETVRPVPLQYEKHMTHHLLPAFGRSWVFRARNAFLIRRPDAVLRSYVRARATVTLEDIGLPQQVELFERVADRSGHAPPVLDADDLLADPAGALRALCEALEIAYTPRMVSWAPGPRATDGVWGPAWYARVWRSTGFEAPAPPPVGPLDDALAALADRARPLYARMSAHARRPAAQPPPGAPG